MKKRSVRFGALLCLAWGVIGGWAMLGTLWAALNTLSKDQVMVFFALAVLISTSVRKEEQ